MEGPWPCFILAQIKPSQQLHFWGPLALGLEKLRLCPCEIRPFPPPWAQVAFFAKSPREDIKKSEEKCKDLKDFCQYFSEEEWTTLGNSEKSTYVYLKRNQDTMTGLGLPALLHPKWLTTESMGIILMKTGTPGIRMNILRRLPVSIREITWMYLPNLKNHRAFLPPQHEYGDVHDQQREKMTWSQYQ